MNLLIAGLVLADQMILDIDNNKYTEFKPMMVLHASSKTTNILKTTKLNQFQFNEEDIVHTLDDAPEITPIKFTTFDDRVVPDYTDKDTIVGMAKMSWKAYYEPKNASELGWGWASPGLRGYIFVPSWLETNDDFEDLPIFEDVKDIVISVKGTSFSLVGGGDEQDIDKRNDNLLFSCCCAHVDASWRDICNCVVESNVCNETCIHREVMGCSSSGCSCPLGTCTRSYYDSAFDILKIVKAKFPQARIHATGHSLGGAMATMMLHMIYADPTSNGRGGGALTYEAPAQRLMLHRLGLLFPAPVFNFGNSADPIFTGECNGKTSSCYFFGYAMETMCHSGFVCEYITRTDGPPPRSLKLEDSDLGPNLGFTQDTPFYSLDDVDVNWRLSITHHRIIPVIRKVLEVYPVPQCIQPTNCTDCESWQFQ